MPRDDAARLRDITDAAVRIDARIGNTATARLSRLVG
jgi:hypothetical protein